MYQNVSVSGALLFEILPFLHCFSFDFFTIIWYCRSVAITIACWCRADSYIHQTKPNNYFSAGKKFRPHRRVQANNLGRLLSLVNAIIHKLGESKRNGS